MSRTKLVLDVFNKLDEVWLPETPWRTCELMRTRGSTPVSTPPFKGVSAVKMNLMFHPCVRDTVEPSAHRCNTHASHPDDKCDVFEWLAKFHVKRKGYDVRAEACSDDRASYKKSETATQSAKKPITWEETERMEFTQNFSVPISLLTRWGSRAFSILAGLNMS